MILICLIIFILIILIFYFNYNKILIFFKKYFYQILTFFFFLIIITLIILNKNNSLLIKTKELENIEEKKNCNYIDSETFRNEIILTIESINDTINWVKEKNYNAQNCSLNDLNYIFINEIYNLILDDKYYKLSQQKLENFSTNDLINLVLNLNKFEIKLLNLNAEFQNLKIKYETLIIKKNLKEEELKLFRKQFINEIYKLFE